MVALTVLTGLLWPAPEAFNILTGSAQAQVVVDLKTAKNALAEAIKMLEDASKVKGPGSEKALSAATATTRKTIDTVRKIPEESRTSLETARQAAEKAYSKARMSLINILTDRCEKSKSQENGRDAHRALYDLAVNFGPNLDNLAVGRLFARQLKCLGMVVKKYEGKVSVTYKDSGILHTTNISATWELKSYIHPNDQVEILGYEATGGFWMDASEENCSGQGTGNIHASLMTVSFIHPNVKNPDPATVEIAKGDNYEFALASKSLVTLQCKNGDPPRQIPFDPGVTGDYFTIYNIENFYDQTTDGGVSTIWKFRAVDWGKP